ncbi:MAG: polyprenyl synthetase family protein [Planctomycetes bacterium]|nr:polyprenyl synthetase family protein [Planctomycetota bacterium]
MEIKFRAAFEQELYNRLNSIQFEISERTKVPFLGESISEFVLNRGKRIRPTLFLIAYYGYAQEPNPDILKIAVALELLHSFALIHDDIVDDSSLRRACDSMHIRLGRLQNSPRANAHSGKALALLAGDVLYTIAIETFISIQEDPTRKEKALQELLQTARSTGAGAFLELCSRQGGEIKVNRNLILQIYNLKTVGYTFACPLKLAAIFADVSQAEQDLLADFAECLGYAYQIKDDCEDLKSFVDSSPEALPMQPEEIRMMLPTWYLYRNLTAENRFWIERLQQPSREDLCKLKELLSSAGAFEQAYEESQKFIDRAYRIIPNLTMQRESREGMAGCLQMFFKITAGNLQEAKL